MHCCFFFKIPILKIWLQIVVKAGAINFDALHQLLYLFYMKCFTRVALCILNGDASLRILSTNASGCFSINVTFIAVAEISIRGDFFSKAIINSVSLTCFSFILFYSELTSLYISTPYHLSSMNIEFHLWYENYRRHFQTYLQWKCLNFNYNKYNFTEVYSQGSNWL